MLSHLRHGMITGRQWQINTLRIFNNNVVEIKEDQHYRVDFRVDDVNMSLDVILSPQFPEDTPTIFINPPVIHPWLLENSNQVVDAPGLLEFTPNSDLGRVVQAIIREFQKALVKPDEKSAPTTPSGSLSFPQLNTLTVSELEEILVNTDLQDKLLDSVPELADMEAKAEEVICGIEKIAQENIAKQELLQSLKAELIEKVRKVVSMKMHFDALNQKHQELLQLFDPHNIKERLKEAALQADEEADEIAQEFLQGKVPVDIFVGRFSEKRALGQSRRAREERLSHQLAQLQVASTPDNAELDTEQSHKV